MKDDEIKCEKGWLWNSEKFYSEHSVTIGSITTKEELLKIFDELEKRIIENQNNHVDKPIFVGRERMELFRKEKERLAIIRPNHKFSDMEILYGITKNII